MSRLSMRPSPSRWETLETATRCCPACGGRLSCHYTNRRAVVTMDGLLGLRLKVRRCVNRGCGRFHRAFRPEAEGAIVLPQQEFGLDLIALVGRLRYVTRASVPEIHAELVRRGVMISERSVTNLLDRYDELVATAMTDPGHLRARFADQGRVVLAIDGLQPEVGHEVLWVIRDCLSGTVVLARALLSSTAADLTPLLCQAAESVGVPVTGVVSDGQRSIRTAVAKALPGVPHQLCHFHYLREAAHPIFEADRHAKKELKKRIRGIRPIERAVEGRQDAEADLVHGYCAAVRSAVTDDGRAPLDPGGLKLKARLEAVADSLQRVDEKATVSFRRRAETGMGHAGGIARRAAENAAGGASTLLARVQHRARGRQGRASRAAARCPMGILDRPCARRLPEARSGRRDGPADRTKGWARMEPSCRRPALCVIEPEAQAGSSFQV
jgi:hypothetical protein